MKYPVFLLTIFILIFLPANISASEGNDINPDTELKAASDYFHNLGIGKFNCDIKVIFDPSGKYKLKDIEKWEIAKGTYVFIGHYNYAEGGIFSLDVFGETIARNDAEIVDMQSTIVVPLLPMPGSIMTGESLKKRYTASYKGISEFDGHECYKIRLDANSEKDEFFKYIEYYIDKDEKVIRQVDCSFDFGMWIGSGHGEFYYTRKKGFLLPNVGFGDIYLRSPYMKRMRLWGKWSGYGIGMIKEKTEEEQEKPTSPN